MAHLVTQYQVEAVRTAFLVTQERRLAEDVVQNAFIKTYERIHQFENGRPFAPWFLRMVVNDAVKAAKRRKRTVLFGGEISAGHQVDFDWLVDEKNLPGELVESQETRARVREAVAKLPPEQRAVIVLKYYVGLKDMEMAVEISAPPGTVKWRLHRARKKLRTLLGDDAKGV